MEVPHPFIPLPTLGQAAVPSIHPSHVRFSLLSASGPHPSSCIVLILIDNRFPIPQCSYPIFGMESHLTEYADYTHSYFYIFWTEDTANAVIKLIVSQKCIYSSLGLHGIHTNQTGGWWMSPSGLRCRPSWWHWAPLQTIITHNLEWGTAVPV